MADVGGMKYWHQGLPLPAVTQAERTAGRKYWHRGLPASVLVDAPAPASTRRGRLLFSSL